ncbi:PIN2 [PSI+] induction protein 2 [Candida maltosa Xu316]|uniref:[PSI+] induction protein 2 n=1 Tax=Candida maltosa (strain Xu316) TaxID=1245528 RepID=M3J8M1_CANMX|nr:hypothetical protein G210_0979 [Candida maltosa Xu316]
MFLYDFNDFKRDILDGASNAANRATSFADSFKSYDTCMANTGCKVIFIVGCVLGGLIVIWILSTLFQCCFFGAKCVEACCCCCCRDKPQNVYYEKPPQTFVNPNMYPPRYDQRYAYQPQPPPVSAYPAHNEPSASEYSYTRHEGGYEPVGGYSHNASNPFNDHYKN